MYTNFTDIYWPKNPQQSLIKMIPTIHQIDESINQIDYALQLSEIYHRDARMVNNTNKFM